MSCVLHRDIWLIIEGQNLIFYSLTHVEIKLIMDQ